MANKSILTLLITLLGALFKYQRQLVLENLMSGQQIIMLRQSVKRPRATAADRVFFGKRDINKRKESTKQPDALDNPTGVNGISSFAPGVGTFSPDRAIYLPENFEGVL